MNEKYALGVDIGGSHIACQVVELGSSRPVGETYTEVKIAENESAQKILADKFAHICVRRAAQEIFGCVDLTARWEPACRKPARAPSRASA